MTAFDVWNEVPLVPQLTGMSCWAAAAAMLVGWRERLPVKPEEVASGAGRWSDYRDGLRPSDVQTLAGAFHLQMEPHRPWTVERMQQRLAEVGPLWLGEASPGLHSIVVTGLYGDGTPDGTFARINDPWPVGRGERYLLSFRDLMSNLGAASALIGGGQVLHAGGRGRGAPLRRSFGGGVARALGATSSRTLAPDALGADSPLDAHGGSGDNLYLTWTAGAEKAQAIDVVVHLHGYSPGAATRATLMELVRDSGLDLAGRARPTLGILPRGRRITPDEIRAEAAAGGKPNPNRYTFPGLLSGNGEGLERLVSRVLGWFATEVARGPEVGRRPAVDRLILTAHSGGGTALDLLLAAHGKRRVCNPNEAHLFDAINGGTKGIVSWARARIDADLQGLRDRARAGLSAADGACRIIWGPSTRDASLEVARALDTPALRDVRAVAAYYRVEQTTVGHGDVARTFGPQLLANASVELAPPPARARGQGYTPGARPGAPVVPDRARLPAPAR